MPWQPDLYDTFAAPRRRPAQDLLTRMEALAPEAPKRIIDLGCGTGQLTLQLAERYPKAKVVGIDSSPAMLDQTAPGGAKVDFQMMDIGDWDPEHPVDILFSNAALHWLPKHKRLFRRLVLTLSPGGVLAVQIPNNYDSSAYRILREAAAEMDQAEELLELLPATRVKEPQQYWGYLAKSCDPIDIWETTYLQALPGEDAVLTWLSGSTLVPVLEALGSEERRENFLNAVRPAIDSQYPRDPKSGLTLFPFKRLFILARRRPE